MDEATVTAMLLQNLARVTLKQKACGGITITAAS